MGGFAWTEEEKNIVREVWPSSDWEEIAMRLPRRTRTTIAKMAATLGVRRMLDIRYPTRKPIHPILRELRKIRMRHGYTRKEIAAKIGYHPVQVAGWETGVRTPTIFGFLCWCEALHVELRLIPRVAGTGKLLSKPQGIRKPDLAKLMAGRAA